MPLTATLGTVLVIGTLAAVPHARAQAQYDDYLFRPAFDGDQNQPPRFRRNPAAARAQRFRTEPTGAGTTGFDSTNAGGKKSSATAKAGQASAARYGAPPERTTANLPIAATLLPQNQTRKGTSPYGIVVNSTPPEPSDSPLLRRRFKLDEAPFDPVGIRAGAFVFKPALELIGGYDTNPARTAKGTASWFTAVSPELLFSSSWQRHEFKGELRGSYTTYHELPSENRPDFNGKLSGRIDVTRLIRLEPEMHFIVSTDNPGSPNIQSGLTRLPIFTTWGGSLDFGQRFNRFDVLVKAGADRTVYQHSTFTDGTTASNTDRNFTQYSAALRCGYEITLGLTPFVETGVDRRVHDLTFDTFGLRRDSDGWYAKAGSTFELTRILTGELAAGWLVRRYKDPSLPDISGPTIDGSLLWLASGLTRVKLTARTAVAESTSFGVSGNFTREVALQVEHAFRRWLVGTLTLTRGFDDYVGSSRRDDRYIVSSAIAYKLTRELQLKSELRREWRHSNTLGNDYTADIVLLGLRLQR